jgi:hypothetical protein
MDAKDYLVQTFEGSAECFMCIFSDDSLDRILLGDSFLRGYYSVYNYETKQFGFAPHAQSTKSASTKTRKNGEKIGDF